MCELPIIDKGSELIIIEEEPTIHKTTWGIPSMVKIWLSWVMMVLKEKEFTGIKKRNFEMLSLPLSRKSWPFHLKT